MIHLTIHHSLTIQSKIQTLNSPISGEHALKCHSFNCPALSIKTYTFPKPQQTGYTSSTQEVEKSQALPETEMLFSPSTITEDNPKSQQTGCTDDSMISMNTGPTKVIEDAQTLPDKNALLEKIQSYRTPANSSSLKMKEITTANSRSKKYFCIYCKKMFSKLVVHLERKHGEEPEVQKFLCYLKVARKGEK
ncbi:uncharacterized protein LOC123316538 [Coccinella septempunctata]|uniref:uncharacterized protein LOC123316538 n=1 Tax=Coccinella septempunctata TaxID=41139 RepID=UPI001D065651|nr:uncharacterized protein LOC123316538 [Coccinella septempunctata]